MSSSPGLVSRPSAQLANRAGPKAGLDPTRTRTRPNSIQQAQDSLRPMMKMGSATVTNASGRVGDVGTTEWSTRAGGELAPVVASG